MIVEVSPSDLRGYVEPHVRRAVLEGTAIPAAVMLGQGDMRALLAAHNAAMAVRRNFDALTTGELQADLRERLAQREERLYGQQPEWAEHVEDLIDDLEVELARRGVQAWVGL